MDTATIAGVVIVSVGALLVGMAGLIKLLVLGRLDELLEGQKELFQRLHVLEVRLTRLETEHEMRCSKQCA